MIWAMAAPAYLLDGQTEGFRILSSEAPAMVRPAAAKFFLIDRKPVCLNIATADG